MLCKILAMSHSMHKSLPNEKVQRKAFNIIHSVINIPYIWPFIIFSDHTTCRHFIALIASDIQSITSHFPTYLLLGSLGKLEDQL